MPYRYEVLLDKCKLLPKHLNRRAPAQEVRELLPDWALLAATGCRYAVTEGLREIVTQQQQQQQEAEAAGEDDGGGDSEVPPGVCAALGLQAFSLSHAVATLQVGRRAGARLELAQPIVAVHRCDGAIIAANTCCCSHRVLYFLLCDSGIAVRADCTQEVLRSGGREPAAAAPQAPGGAGGAAGAAVGGASWCWRVLALLEGLMEAREVSQVVTLSCNGT